MADHTPFTPLPELIRHLRAANPNVALKAADEAADLLDRLETAGLTTMLMLNAALLCEGQIPVDQDKRAAITAKLTAVGKVLDPHPTPRALETPR